MAWTMSSRSRGICGRIPRRARRACPPSRGRRALPMSCSRPARLASLHVGAQLGGHHAGDMGRPRWSAAARSGRSWCGSGGVPSSFTSSGCSPRTPVSSTARSPSDVMMASTSRRAFSTISSMWVGWMRPSAMSFSSARRATSRRTGSKQETVIASGVSSMMRSDAGQRLDACGCCGPRGR